MKWLPPPSVPIWQLTVPGMHGRAEIGVAIHQRLSGGAQLVARVLPGGAVVPVPADRDRRLDRQPQPPQIVGQIA